ncbi:MAG: PQQ-dependent sugar dehydrogenase [Thiolinea sp.]
MKIGLWRRIVFSLLIMLLMSISQVASAAVNAVKVVGELDHPWSMVFLPDGDMLISERGGQLRRTIAGQLQAAPVSGLPKITALGQGGLMGLVLHPRFEQNRLLYFAYTAEVASGGYNTHVARGEYRDGALRNVEQIFAATPGVKGGRHFGGRLLFDKAGFLYVTLGDRGQRNLAQQPDNHTGSLIRLHDDGRVPADNPFVGQEGYAPEIFSYGHRNAQGIALNPFNGHIWTHEHGPRGGDEVNVIKRGANYGWPVISYGEEYFGGSIGEGLTEKAGMEQPLHYWVPSIAPSGMAFYNGDKYPGWKGSLFVGSLKFGLLVRLSFTGDVVKEERMLDGAVGRIRDVLQGPDGYLYLLTDQDEGGVYRLE